jgi:hypothetical protein
MLGTVVTAVIAAAASIVAAVFAFASSKSASNSAREVVGVNQRVVRLDREVDQLRDDYKEFLHRLTEVDVNHKGSVQLYIQAEVLAVNPLCSEDLRRDCRFIASMLGPQTAPEVLNGFKLADAMERVRLDLGAILETQATEREHVLSPAR